jgi:large subunit ribosomal protein L2
MALKKLRPTSPGTRFRIAPAFDEVTASRPEKSLTVGLNKSGGRNRTGKMTMRYTGGGHKRQYRLVDFKRAKHGVPATVKSIEYDPNRTARIALLYYADGAKSYILAPANLQVGATVVSGPTAAPEVGNALPLAAMPLGTILHNIELRPGQGGQMARSAGTYAQLVAREERYATLRLPSGESRMVLTACYATVGTVSNGDHMNVRLGKAGRSRWMGIRPRVRGVAMNPVDHPMGGGEGRSSGGHPRSRNGIFAKGQKTRAPKKQSDQYIVSRRKPNK